jgi:hypothetical protein
MNEQRDPVAQAFQSEATITALGGLVEHFCRLSTHDKQLLKLGELSSVDVRTFSGYNAAVKLIAQDVEAVKSYIDNWPESQMVYAHDYIYPVMMLLKIMLWSGVLAESDDWYLFTLQKVEAALVQIQLPTLFELYLITEFSFEDIENEIIRLTHLFDMHTLWREAPRLELLARQIYQPAQSKIFVELNLMMQNLETFGQAVEDYGSWSRVISAWLQMRKLSGEIDIVIADDVRMFPPNIAKIVEVSMIYELRKLANQLKDRSYLETTLGLPFALMIKPIFRKYFNRLTGSMHLHGKETKAREFAQKLIEAQILWQLLEGSHLNEERGRPNEKMLNWMEEQIDYVTEIWLASQKKRSAAEKEFLKEYQPWLDLNLKLRVALPTEAGGTVYFSANIQGDKF